MELASAQMKRGVHAMEHRWCCVFTHDYTQACPWFAQAADSYRHLQEWELAASAFAHLATCHEHLHQFMLSARDWRHAAECHLYHDVRMAVQCYGKSCVMYQTVSRWSHCERTMLAVARILEPIDPVEAVSALHQAYLYSGMGHPSPDIQYLIRIGVIHSAHEHLADAAAVFEQIGNWFRALHLAEATDYFVKAIVCHLILHPPSAEQYYYTWDMHYPNLLDLIHAVMLNETDHVKVLIRECELEPWMVRAFHLPVTIDAESTPTHSDCLTT